MQNIWFLIYNYIAVPLFWLILNIAALFKTKVRKGIRGRKRLFEQIEQNQMKLTSAKRIWFHSSSMGEFEQAKPIIASLKKKFPEINIIATFFSPSGYDHSKHYKHADIISYIPFDTKTNARRFLDLLKPTAAVFVRYDIWPNHLWELKSRGIPAFIANATMRTSSIRFYPLLKNFHRSLFNNFTSILTVSEKDAQIFNQFGLNNPNVEAIGETRYDQVWQRRAEAKEKHLIPGAILKGKKIFLAGSTWPEDEEIILPAIRKLLEDDPDILAILVPHEPTIDAIENIENQTQKIDSIRFSALNDYKNERIIIVDSVGVLMTLYQYANAAYVGGSFKQGIHNVLEPAVYGIPVVFGPKHLNSQEAIELIKRKGGFVISNREDCLGILLLLLNDKKSNNTAGNLALKLVQENIGATERFIDHLVRVL